MARILKMMYDDLLKKIGEFGWYQKRIFAVTCMQPITSGLLLLISIFTMATPPHRCAIPGYTNDTYHQQNNYHGNLINESIPQSSSCLLRNTTVDKYGNVTSLEYKCSSWVYDTSIFTSTFVTEFDMVCGNATLKSNAVMVLFLGLLLGYGLLGNIADLFGRKPLMVVSNYVFVICAYLMVWSPNYTVLLVLRFFLGLSMGGQALTCYIIGVEFVGPSKRRYTGVISNLTWCLGLLMISLFGYLIRNWRYLHLTAAIFSSHLLFFFLIIPESPRWLLTKGYTVKARKIINEIAKFNKKIISETVINALKVPANVTTAKFWKLCSTKKRSLRTFVIYFMWFAVSVSYFGIMLNLETLVGDIYLNLVLATIAEAASYMVVILTVERLGRKRLLCGCLVLGSIALIAVILIIMYAPSDLKWLMTGFTLLGQFGINGAFGVCWLWTSELFPTELRNVGIGTSSASARIGSVVAPYLKLLGSLMPGRFQEVSPFILFCIVCIVALVLTLLLLPETFHQNLPDTVEDAERLGDGNGEAVDEKEIAASMLGPEVKRDASFVI